MHPHAPQQAALMSAKRDQSEGSLEGAEEDEDDREEQSYNANEAGNDHEEDVYYEDEEGDEEGDDGYESSESGDRKQAASDTLGSEQQPKPKKRRRRRVISTLQESKWQQMYQRLLIFRQMTGDCLVGIYNVHQVGHTVFSPSQLTCRHVTRMCLLQVPNRYAADPSLGAWGMNPARILWLTRATSKACNNSRPSPLSFLFFPTFAVQWQRNVVTIECSWQPRMSPLA